MRSQVVGVATVLHNIVCRPSTKNTGTNFQRMGSVMVRSHTVASQHWFLKTKSRKSSQRCCHWPCLCAHGPCRGQVRPRGKGRCGVRMSCATQDVEEAGRPTPNPAVPTCHRKQQNIVIRIGGIGPMGPIFYLAV